MFKFISKGRNSKPEGIPLLLLLIGCGALLIFICSAVSSAIILSFEDPGSLIGVGSLGAVICAAGICGAITSLLTEGNFKYSLIISGVLALILFLLPFLFGGKIGAGVMNSLCYFGICISATPIFKKKRRKRR